MQIPSEKNGWLAELVCKNRGETYRSRAVAVTGGSSLQLFMIRNPVNQTIKYGWYQSFFSSVYESEYPYGPKMLTIKLDEVELGEMQDPFPANSKVDELPRRFAIVDGTILMQYDDEQTESVPTSQSAYEIRVVLRPPGDRRDRDSGPVAQAPSPNSW